MSLKFCHLKTFLKISLGFCDPLTPILQFRHLSGGIWPSWISWSLPKISQDHFFYLWTGIFSVGLLSKTFHCHCFTHFQCSPSHWWLKFCFVFFSTVIFTFAHYGVTKWHDFDFQVRLWWQTNGYADGWQRGIYGSINLKKFMKPSFAQPKSNSEHWGRNQKFYFFASGYWSFTISAHL